MHCVLVETRGKQMNALIAAVSAKREAAGLKLTWFIPAENRTFTVFASTESVKARWLAQAAERGWQLQQ